MKVSLLVGAVFLTAGGCISAQTVEFYHNGQLKKGEIINDGLKKCRELSLKDDIITLTGDCGFIFKNNSNNNQETIVLSESEELNLRFFPLPKYQNEKSTIRIEGVELTAKKNNSLKFRSDRKPFRTYSLFQ